METLKTMIIEGVPEDLRRNFKVLCTQNDISMREAIIRLMGLEVEKRILIEPIKKKE